MATIKVKGYEFPAVLIKDSFGRRAVQYKNAIIQSLKKIGILERHTDIVIENAPFKKIAASATWYHKGHRRFYQYDGANNYAENMYIVSKVIEFEVNQVAHGTKHMQDFINAFAEEDDVDEQRKAARELLGVDHDTKDMDLINKKYKDLARAHHPDTPTGDAEKFKAVNKAHKILKRELE